MSTMFLVSYVVLWLMVVGLGVMVLATLRHMSQMISLLDPTMRLASELSPLRKGDAVPQVSLATPDGETLTVPPTGKSGTLLLWLSEGCPPCHRLLTDVRTEILDSALTGWDVRLIVKGPARAAQSLQAAHQLEGVSVLFDERGECARQWGFPGTPAAIAVDADGKLLRVLAVVDGRTIRALLGHAPASPKPMAMLLTGREV